MNGNSIVISSEKTWWYETMAVVFHCSPDGFQFCGDNKPVSPHESAVGQDISVRYGDRLKGEGYIRVLILMGKYIVVVLIQLLPSHWQRCHLLESRWKRHLYVFCYSQWTQLDHHIEQSAWTMGSIWLGKSTKTRMCAGGRAGKEIWACGGAAYHQSTLIGNAWFLMMWEVTVPVTIVNG